MLQTRKFRSVLGTGIATDTAQAREPDGELSGLLSCRIMLRQAALSCAYVLLLAHVLHCITVQPAAVTMCAGTAASAQTRPHSPAVQSLPCHWRAMPRHSGQQASVIVHWRDWNTITGVPAASSLGHHNRHCEDPVLPICQSGSLTHSCPTTCQMALDSRFMQLRPAVCAMRLRDSAAWAALRTAPATLEAPPSVPVSVDASCRTSSSASLKSAAPFPLSLPPAIFGYAAARL